MNEQSSIQMGSKIQRLATDLIHTYFTTQLNPLVRHHIDSYDQFLQEGIQATIQSNNPLIILKNPKVFNLILKLLINPIFKDIINIILGLN
jgi:DNA-directed RNA polymerase beta subunit